MSNGIFYIGSPPANIYLLPKRTNVMVNARRYWTGSGWSRKHTGQKTGGKMFLDCGGYVFFNQHGKFPFSVAMYLNLVSILRPTFYASMDYPCEPSISSELASMSVKDRIHATLDFCEEAMEMECLVTKGTLVPVIQGWELEDYCYCLDLYASRGMLRPYMAIGSMCTRSNSAVISSLVRGIHEYATNLGVQRLHAFGLKRSVHLAPVQHLIYSRDSAASLFAHTKAMKAQWGGRRFANGVTEKKQAIAYLVEDLTKRGFEWSS